MIQDRIDHLLLEIEQFNIELLKRRQQIDELRLEILEIEKGMLTRQGGIVELKKLIEERETVVNEYDESDTP